MPPVFECIVRLVSAKHRLFWIIRLGATRSSLVVPLHHVRTSQMGQMSNPSAARILKAAFDRSQAHLLPSTIATQVRFLSCPKFEQNC